MWRNAALLLFFLVIVQTKLYTDVAQLNSTLNSTYHVASFSGPRILSLEAHITKRSPNASVDIFVLPPEGYAAFTKLASTQPFFDPNKLEEYIVDSGSCFGVTRSFSVDNIYLGINQRYYVVFRLHTSTSSATVEFELSLHDPEVQDFARQQTRILAISCGVVLAVVAASLAVGIILYRRHQRKKAASTAAYNRIEFVDDASLNPSYSSQAFALEDDQL